MQNSGLSRWNLGSCASQQKACSPEERGEAARRVVNARWANPLDEELILKLADHTRCLVTVEDGVAAGGFGSAVAELLQKHECVGVRLSIIALPPAFVEHGPAQTLRAQYGLCAEHITKHVCSLGLCWKNTSNYALSASSSTVDVR